MMELSNPLNDLVHRADELTAQIESYADLPRVERNFSQLLEAGQQLWQRTSTNTNAGPGGTPGRVQQGSTGGRSDAPDVSASVLLGSRGYDVQRVSQQLDSLSAATKKPSAADAGGAPGMGPSSGLFHEGNIQGFLERERETVIVEILDSVRKQTARQVEDANWRNVKRDWEQEKLKILNSLVGSSQDVTDLNLSLDATMNASLSGGGTSPSGGCGGTVSADRSLRDVTMRSTHSKIRSLMEPSYMDSKLLVTMDPIEAAYSQQVERYVDQLVSGSSHFNLIDKFSAAMSAEVTVEQSALDMWEIVNFMVRGLPLPIGVDCVAHRTQPTIQLVLIRNARNYLELKYRQFMESQIYGGSRSASAIVNADSATLFSLIKQYLSSKMPSWMGMSLDTTSPLTPGGGGGSGSHNRGALSNLEDGTVEGHPIWCFIWHALRAGALDAAIDIAARGSSPAINTEFVNILKECRQQAEDQHQSQEYHQGLRLSPKTENHLRLLYKRSVRMSPDPYKKAVYSLLAACDITEPHQDAVEKPEDFLWMRLCQVRVDEVGDTNSGLSSSSFSSPASDMSFPRSSGNPGPDRISYGRLAGKISEELGETHFNARDKPHQYITLLLLSGQFESAIDYAWRAAERLRPHALHLAVTLYESGLLALPSHHLNVALISRLTSDPQGIRRLNFARLLMMYVGRFEVRNTIESLNYYYLLRSIRDSSDTSADITTSSSSSSNLFLTNVSRLVRETKKFDDLLGVMSDDGCRIPGAVDKFCGNVTDIIEKVASDCEAVGQNEDAVRLYDLAGNSERALELINKLLGVVAAERKSQGMATGQAGRRESVEQLALCLAGRYHRIKSRLPTGLASTFFLLVDLMAFFDLYHTRQMIDALTVIEKLAVVPLREVEVDLKVNEFNRYAEEIRKNVPEILLATMTALYEQYKTVKSSSVGQSSNRFGISPTPSGPSGSLSSDGSSRTDSLVDEIRRKAKCLVKYAGMIPFRMPGDYNARLVHLEVMIT